MIVGLFPDAETAPVTQASELANLLGASDYLVSIVSKHRNKWRRLFDIVLTLFTKGAWYDVAIVQFYSGNSFVWQAIAAHIVKLLGKQLVFTIHGGGVPAAIAASKSNYLSVLNKADVITVPSTFMAQALSAYNIKTTLIENTIKLNRYPFYKKDSIRPTLLWMRSFGDIYNPLMAVRVVNTLKIKYPSVKMYMGGIDMGALKPTEQLIADLGLVDNITIAGFMNFEKKTYYADICDVYLSTNNVDNAPVTFIEMWAMGLPVVSTNVGGVPYLIEDNEDGLLAPVNDHEAMAAKIAELIENKVLADKLIANGRQRVAAYDEATVYRKWNSLLTAL